MRKCRGRGGGVGKKGDRQEKWWDGVGKKLDEVEELSEGRS